MNLPNAITVLRLLMVPAVPILFYQGQPYWAMAVFLLAGFSDVLDGYLARKLDQITKFGKLVDPLADKIMLITTMICLYCYNYIPLWITIVMLLKELAMVVGAAILYKTDVVIPANLFGKVATFLFTPAIVLAFFAGAVAPWHIVALIVSTAAAYVAMVQYGLKAFKLHREKKTQPPQA